MRFKVFQISVFHADYLSPFLRYSWPSSLACRLAYNGHSYFFLLNKKVWLIFCLLVVVEELLGVLFVLLYSFDGLLKDFDTSS